MDYMSLSKHIVANRKLPLIGIVLFGFIATESVLAETGITPKEVDAVYQLAGQRMGVYSEKRTIDDFGNVITAIDSDMVFNRLGSRLELKSSSRYKETMGGDLLEVDSVSTSSQQPTKIHAVIDKDTIDVITTAGGRSYERSIALSGRLMGPDAAKRLSASRLRAAGDSVSYQIFSPELGSVVTVREKAIALNAATGDDIKVEQTISGMSTPLTIWMDRTGWLVREVIASPLGEIEVVRSDAGSEMTVEKGATLAAETFSRSIAAANIRLPEERMIEQIKLKIIAKHPAAEWPDFSAENQRVIQQTPDYVVLEVRRVLPDSEGTGPLAPADSVKPYLEPNALLQSDDPEVRRIENAVVHNGDSAWAAARALQAWTAENLHFDPGIAIVPASEVAKSRGGTCFGYSVLLGALARAAGIPSRIRMGLVYAGGIWGGHAWVEVRIGQQWIPIDGALYAPGPADAARFSVYTSSLENGIGTLGGLAQILGNVDVKILEYTVNGKRTVVSENATPYTIAGDVYRNPWLGISVTKPSDFAFTTFEVAWPQTTLVAMKGPDGRRIEIHDESTSLPVSEVDRNKVFHSEGINAPYSIRRIAGRDLPFAQDDKSAGVLLEGRGAVWMVKATGDHAPSLLDQVVPSISAAY